MQFDASMGMATIAFDGKPPEHIRAILKSNGFRWSRAGGYWWRRKVTGSADIYTAIQKQMRPADHSDGPCWRCKQPGTFRNYGPATPVYCDACNKDYAEQRRAAGC